MVRCSPLHSPGASERAFARFARASGGVSAIEFALILPVLLAIFVGLSEYAHAVDNWRKVTQLARTVSDLTAQGDAQNPIDASLMRDILATSTLVLKPFDASGVKIVVSAMAVDLTNLNLIPRVCSSTANANASPRATGAASDLTVPTGFRTNGVRYVLTEVSMPYTPMLGSALVKLVNGATSTITLKSSMPWPARGGQPAKSTYTEVWMPGGAACP
ncbi:pilus assembly protein [Methylobacterium sp. E-041]|uniref:TadE/TadG family type IV pilus assembly protein n=1 Tax=Methylobacterium sp. E-041 TaxID=2836573 RepID=UPI0024448054